MQLLEMQVFVQCFYTRTSLATFGNLSRKKRTIKQNKSKKYMRCIFTFYSIGVFRKKTYIYKNLWLAT